ncbi:MAG: M14 family metallopeptidase [Acidobacteriota bacterium]|nr:M14 family metallopeptidase [Acidobacteriota bacterium]
MNNRFRTRNRAGISAAVLAVFFLASSAVPAAVPAAKNETAGYMNHETLSASLRGLVSGHKNLARLQSIGKTREGRDIWLLEIANAAGVPPGQRPALFVGANFEADQIVGSALALHLARHLLENYARDPEVKRCLDEQTVYIAPRMNPDGAEDMFASVKTGRRTNLSPRDLDNDGRTDEDGPEDLNKDGVITVMRVESPDGRYIADPEEPRLLRRAEAGKGEKGVYKVFWEGRDMDGDGFIAEDPPGGTDINRNFTHAYPYYQPDAGPHMISEAESQALMDWIVARRNVAAILTFGASDNLVVPPDRTGRLGPERGIDLLRFAEESVTDAAKTGMFQTGSPFGRFGRMAGGGFFDPSMLALFQRSAQPEQTGRPRMPARNPAVTVNAADIEYFRAIGETYVELTGIRRLPPVREAKGAFFQYGYFQFGVPSFSTPGWGIPAPAPQRAATPQAAGRTPTPAAERPAMAAAGGGAQFMRQMMAGRGAETAAAPAAASGIDREMLKWMDAEGIDGFVSWTKFKHPELGEVEIGGFKPHALSNPPASALPGLGEAHAKFALHLLSHFPRVRFASTDVTAHGGGFFHIKAEIENSGFLPTALAQGVASRGSRPIMVQIQVPPDDVIAGNPKTNFLSALDGSGRRAKFEWLIRGKPGDKVEIRVVSQKGGADTASVVLR